MHLDEQISNYNMPDTEDGVPYQIQNEEVVAMIEESPSGDESVQGNDSSRSGDGSTVLQVKTIHISSPILAAKSPFFYKCNQLLQKLPMTCEAAFLYLGLPSTLLTAQAVQPLTEVAKQFLAGWFKDITKFQEQVKSLPLAGIEAALSSDELQVATEDAVYDFVLKWARTYYSKLQEQREILGTPLARLIRFSYMTWRKLKGRQCIVSSLCGACIQVPPKVVEFGLPRQQCVVYLDLKREQCAQLFPAGRVYSQAFNLGGQGFFLSAQCNMYQQSSYRCFGLFLGMQDKKGSATFPVDYEFAARLEIGDQEKQFLIDEYIVPHCGGSRAWDLWVIGYVLGFHGLIMVDVVGMALVRLLTVRKLRNWKDKPMKEWFLRQFGLLTVKYTLQK
ncbi:unnamed protein product [Ilex paraguariensis]|uniref:BACK domain-containing protein n=1 Tax=Ilex paraguariensis TaxID=185542 RepID=A0ABC8TWJ9_9AQUA